MSGWITNGVSQTTLPVNPLGQWSVDTQNTQGQNPETVAVSFNNASTLLGANLPMQPSRFYGLPDGATPGTLLTVTGTLYAYPIYIAGTTLVKTIGLNVTTGQTGGAAHVGLYADNGAGYPGALLTGSDTGALAATATASVSNTINLTVNAGWYWLAAIFTASGTFPTVSSAATGYGAASNALLGSDTVAHLVATSGEAASGITVAATYGTLASLGTSFPTGAALRLNADIPLVILGT